MDTTYPTSLMIYLYADEFIAPAHGLFGRAALAPRSGEKVDLKELVIRVYAAAFMDMVDSGVIRLEPLEVKKFLGRETALIAALRPGAAAPQDFLTGQMVDRLLDKRKPEESRVREVIISMVGRARQYQNPLAAGSQPDYRRGRARRHRAAARKTARPDGGPLQPHRKHAHARGDRRRWSRCAPTP